VVAGTVTFGMLLFFWVITWNQAAANDRLVAAPHAGLAVRPLLLFARARSIRRTWCSSRCSSASFCSCAALARVAALAGDPLSFVPRAVVAALAGDRPRLRVAGFTQAVAERHSVRWDLTPSRSFSISEVTRNVLGG